MFAVPGWSVSADALKAETAAKATNGAGTSTPSSKSKKRKRGGGAAAAEQVTATNVSDLYESVVEGKKKARDPRPEQQSSKRQKKEGTDEDKKQKKKEKKGVKDAEPPLDIKNKKKEDVKDTQPPSSETKDKKSKKDKKQKKSKAAAESQKAYETPAANPTSDAIAKAPPPPLPPAPPKLTPLQASMRQKLISARFRHLNETLYTRPSEEAYTLFQESPEMFDEYHEGFRRQVKVWPENPVDSFLADIRRRAKVRTPHGKGGGKSAPSSSSLAPLPRTAGTCTIADLGCGDARLAESLQSDKGKMRVNIHSYDLQSPSPLVTKADIANLPLEDSSVNVAIFCLALMGTNWIDFVEEAYRVLHWKGELWVAEIKSRFGPVRSKNAPVRHSVGNLKKSTGKKNDEGPAFEDDLAVEVDGVDDRRRETDVSAFVEVLRRRGFVLRGEPSEAIDKSNKMFVKMHFIKGAAPTVGKGVKADEQGKGGRKGMARWNPPRDAEDDEDLEGREASVLKPCVYKIR